MPSNRSTLTPEQRAALLEAIRDTVSGAAAMVHVDEFLVDLRAAGLAVVPVGDDADEYDAEDAAEAEREAMNEEALRFTCPTCELPPFSPCMVVNGHRSGETRHEPHSSRRGLAYDNAIQEGGSHGE